MVLVSASDSGSEATRSALAFEAGVLVPYYGLSNERESLPLSSGDPLPSRRNQLTSFLTLVSVVAGIVKGPATVLPCSHAFRTAPVTCFNHFTM